MRQLPQINEVQKKLMGRGLVVVAIAVQDTKARVQKLARDRSKWAVRFGLDLDLKVARAYRFDAIPHGVLIDTQGTIRAIHLSDEKDTAQKLEKEVQSLLPSARPAR